MHCIMVGESKESEVSVCDGVSVCMHVYNIGYIYIYVHAYHFRAGSSSYTVSLS